MIRPWLVRRFDVAAVDPRGRAAAAGRRIRVDDPLFPLALRTLAQDVELARVRGHLGLHVDRDYNAECGGTFPFRKSEVWSLVLWSAGHPAAILRRPGRSARVVPMEPGLALWTDIAVVEHGITSLSSIHPDRPPEVVMVQVLATPRFMLAVAVKDATAAVASSFAAAPPPGGR